MKSSTIAIAGNSGSGKTTLSKIIATEILKDGLILECDRYHKWERGHANWDTFTHLDPEANYLDQMYQDVNDLFNNNTIYQVDYDHKDGTFTPKNKIEPNKHLIVCGLHSFYHKNFDPYCLKIFMDTDKELQVTWKMNRDKKKRGYTYSQIVEQIERRKEDYSKFILPQRNEADVSIKFIRNRHNKMSYSLFITLSGRIDSEKISSDFSNLGIPVRTTILDNKSKLYFDNYQSINELNKYDNFYDYIIFLIKGILDGSY
tara:strand:+ start:753 stop:1529 length:777 start_codon:yes stop_codon:yes gene_type:complete